MKTPGDLTFRSELKTKTLEEHEGLEAASRIMRADFTFDDNQSILEKWFVFYATFEDMLDETETRYPEIFEFMKDRRKVLTLQQDLESMRKSVSLETDEAADVRRFLTARFANRESLWGALYVLEGSTLGAQFITKHLTSHFSIQDERGVQFYKGYGEATGRRWKEFVQKLEELDLSTEEIEIGVDSARKMFRFFGHFLERKNPISPTTFAEQI